MQALLGKYQDLRVKVQEYHQRMMGAMRLPAPVPTFQF